MTKEALKRDSWIEDVSNTLQHLQDMEEVHFDWNMERFTDMGEKLKELKAEMERVTLAVSFLQGFTKAGLDKSSQDSDASSESSPRDSDATLNELRESILKELKVNLEDGLQQIRQDIINEMNTKLDKEEPSTPSAAEDVDFDLD